MTFFQEHKADNAIDSFETRTTSEVRVLRDRTWIEIRARELVPDDVIRVRLGDIIPADAQLFNGEYVLVDESALTRESLP